MNTDELRWLLGSSEFRGTLGIIDLDKIRSGTSSEEAFEPVESEPRLSRPPHTPEPA